MDVLPMAELVTMRSMKRRAFLVLPLIPAGDLVMAELSSLQGLDESLRWLDRLQHSASATTLGAWPIGAVLEHLAQSVEMSMDGFPRQNSRLFQKTVGSAAFAFFQWRGKMSHDLAEPIPGAPALSATQWQLAALRLREAIARFNGYNGMLKPHFAYGPLSKAEYAQAHAMHIANHRAEIRVA
jgi:hypothetical protein